MGTYDIAKTMLHVVLMDTMSHCRVITVDFHLRVLATSRHINTVHEEIENSLGVEKQFRKRRGATMLQSGS